MIIFESKIPALCSWFFPVDAITIGPLIFVRPGKGSPRLLQHEKIHVAQGIELAFVGFWFLYIGFWLLNVWKYGNPRDAYRMIPFEIEARRHQHEPNYLATRPHYNWRKFTG